MIVTTTPTGNLGRQVLARLLAADTDPVRVIVRDPAKLPAGVAARAEIVVGSHGDPAVIDEALRGADALFWLTPPPWRAERLADGMERFARPAAEAVRNHGVGHVVGISNLGRGVPGDAGLVTHGLAVEDLFAASGAAYRPIPLPGFMDNLLASAPTLRDAGRFHSVLDGSVRVPLVASADIVDVVTGLLLDRSWDGHEARPVLGPEDLSMDEAAAILAEVLDRDVQYVRLSPDEFRAGLLARGASPAMADGMLAMMAAKNAGLDNALPRTPANSSPTTLREWAEKVLRPAVIG
ncbi:MAG TPA: NAD(P)H-binding protein [Jatrophihabitans sp.]|nr:NAD(P)H-binding protein [Jatrophihabitans sp.]